MTETGTNPSLANRHTPARFRVVFTNDARIIAGGERYLLHLAEGLRDRGHDVAIAPLAGSELAAESRARRFTTFEIPYAANGGEPRAVTCLIRSLRGRAVDIIHSNANRDRTIGGVAARIIRARSVASIHSCLSICRNLTHRFRNRWLIDLFTPVGYSTERIMVEQDGIARERIRVIHIGIPDLAPASGMEMRAALRASWGLDDHHCVLGNMANLFDFKGHTFLLRALHSLLPRHPQLRAVIAGDGDRRAALEAEAATLGIADRVHFLGRRSDIRALLAAFDVYVQPSKDKGGETFPVSILEAMSCSLPIVASDVGDIGHMIDEGVNGCLCRPEDSGHLAGTLARIVVDRAHLAALGAASRAKFLRQFMVDAMVRNMEEAYAGLFAGFPKS